ncbi:sensor histidine kinase [Streptomyces sp. NPDC088354]|uniref:sensor histidine kinase n=1 Tax=Streptomyces sp. NPDC088354 TaxID=3365856 RepID=UPI00380FBD39
MRLSTRVALAVVAVVPLLVLASGALLIRLVAADLHAQQDAHLRERAAAVAPDARALLRVTAADRPAAEQARSRRLFASALDVGIRVVGPDGTVEGGPLPAASVALPAIAPRPVTVGAGGIRWRVLSRPVAGSRKGAKGTLWVFSPDAATEAQLRRVRLRVLTVALLAAPLSGLLAWAAAGRAVRPLRRLQHRAGGLDPRVSAVRLEHTPTRLAEVDDLARTLQTVLSRYDEQAARTGEALATARSFAATASHELRNPLMSIGTNLDILARYPDLPAGDRAEVLEDLRAEHARVLGLLVMLRALAQGDLVEEDTFVPVDAGELVDAAAADLRRRHPDARVTVTTAPGLLVRGWEQGLRSMADNLLTNALVHGRPAGGPPAVEVVLRRGGDERAPAVVLTVDDHGPGVAPESRAAVFERFHHRPGSPGSGLGLTLVAQQIALHRGTVVVGDRPDGGPGARFEIRLPLSGVRGGEPTLPLLRRDWLSAQRRQEPQGFHKDAP